MANVQSATPLSFLTPTKSSKKPLTVKLDASIIDRLHEVQRRLKEEGLKVELNVAAVVGSALMDAADKTERHLNGRNADRSAG